MTIHRPITIVELHQPKCTRVYGTSPCTAAVGVTGERKCFNTFATCQDKDNFNTGSMTLRFAIPNQDLPLEWDCIPSLRGVNIKPSKLNIAGLSNDVSPLGVRAAVSMTFQDHPDGDTKTDPYYVSRAYKPYLRGTFWGKWLARNKNWEDVQVDVRTGDLFTQALDHPYEDGFSTDTSGEWSLGIEAVDGTKTVTLGSLVYTKGAGDGLRPRIVRAVDVKVGNKYNISIPAPTGTATRKELWVSENSTGGFNEAITPVVNNEALEATFIARVPTVYVVVRAGTDSATGETVSIGSVLLTPTAGLFDRRTYFLEKVDGPDANGRVTLTAKDVLSRSDKEKTTVPLKTEGRLRSSINASATSLELEVDEPVGTKFDHYTPLGSSGGHIRINDEIISFASITAGSASNSRTFTSLARGLYGTQAASHDTGDQAQACQEWEDKKPWEVIKDLLTPFGRVPSEWIPVDEWEAENDRWLDPYELTGIVSEPTPVLDVVAEIANSCMLNIWTDEKEKKVKLRAVRPVDENVIDITDDINILAGSKGRQNRMDEQVSAVFIYYNQKSAIEDIDDQFNYNFVRGRVGEQLGEPRDRVIYSRWLKTDAMATETARVLMTAANDLPVYITATIGLKDKVKVADIVRVRTRILQDETGATLSSLFQVVQINERLGESSAITLKSIGGFPTIAKWMGDAPPDFATATDEEKDSGAWWSDEDGNIGGVRSPYVWS